MAVSLSPLDESFLLLERRWAPMHFAGLSIIDAGSRPAGPLTLDDLRACVPRRLWRLPRLHRRPEFPWHGLGHAVWAVAAMDPLLQVQRHVLPSPGGEEQLLNLVGVLHGRPLDHLLPLWELHLIDGLANGRQALLMKIHHSVADGIGGFDVASALFDRVPRARVRARPAARRPEPAVPAWLLPLQLAEGTAQLLAGVLAPLGSLFAHPVGPRRAFGRTTLATADLLAAKERLGVTVDDLLLEIVATGLRRHLLRTAVEPPSAVRVMVPISTRRPGRDRANQVTMMLVDLPLGGEPADITQAVAARKSRLRQAHEGAAMDALVQASGLLPEPLQRAVVRLLTGRPTFNAVVSDIPGPAEPYSLLGARVEAMYPLMPLAPMTGLSIAALWVGGVVGVGVTADPGQLPDPQGLATEIAVAANEVTSLRRAAARRGRRSAAGYVRPRRAASASKSGSARPQPR